MRAYVEVPVMAQEGGRDVLDDSHPGRWYCLCAADAAQNKQRRDGVGRKTTELDEGALPPPETGPGWRATPGPNGIKLLEKCASGP